MYPSHDSSIRTSIISPVYNEQERIMAFCRQQGWDFLILVRMMVNSFVRLLSLSSRLGNEGAIRAADIVCAGKEFLAYMGIGLAAVPFELRRRPELIPYNDVVRL